METSWLLAIPMLGIAALRDLRDRRVANSFWPGWFTLAATLVVMQWESVTLYSWLLHAGLASLAFAFYGFRLFGGADVKCIWALCLFSLPGGNLAIIALVLASLSGPLTVVGTFLWNLAHRQLAFPAMLLGVPVNLSSTKIRHFSLLQVMSGESLVWRTTKTPISSEANQEEILAVRDSGHDRVWVTMRLPFIAFLLLGWLVAPIVAEFTRF